MQIKPLSVGYSPGYYHEGILLKEFQQFFFKLYGLLKKVDKAMEDAENEEVYYSLIYDFFDSSLFEAHSLNWQSNIETEGMFLSLGENILSLIWVVSPDERSGMISRTNLEKPVMKDVIHMLDFFQEKGIKINKVIITNVFEWYVFQDPNLIQFGGGEVLYTHFYGLEPILESSDYYEEYRLKTLFKLFSPAFLLSKDYQESLDNNIERFEYQLEEIYIRFEGNNETPKTSAYRLACMLGSIISFCLSSLVGDDCDPLPDFDLITAIVCDLLPPEEQRQLTEDFDPKHKDLIDAIHAFLCKWRIYSKPSLHLSENPHNEISLFQLICLIQRLQKRKMNTMACEEAFDLTDLQALEEWMNNKTDINRWKDKLPTIACLTPSLGDTYFRLILEILNLSLESNPIPIEVGEHTCSRLKVYQNWIGFENENGTSLSNKHFDSASYALEERLFYILTKTCWAIESHIKDFVFLKAQVILLTYFFRGRKENFAYEPLKLNLIFGNPLLNRFSLSEDLKKALVGSPFTVGDYLYAIQQYNLVCDSQDKLAAKLHLQKIQSYFVSYTSRFDKRKRKLQRLENEFFKNFQAPTLWNASPEVKGKNKEELAGKIKYLRAEVLQDENGENFEQAVEWRFEIPELLDENGNWVGFDLIWGVCLRNALNHKGLHRSYLQRTFSSYEYHTPIHAYMIERIFELLKSGGSAYIALKNADWNRRFVRKFQVFLAKRGACWIEQTSTSKGNAYLKSRLSKDSKQMDFQIFTKVSGQ